MTQTSEFFDLIYPAAGWRCLFVLPTRQHYWFQDNEQMARAALGLDARGYAVFHSCATFDSRERKQVHVQGIQCFWLDIDAGPGKPYPDARTAYRAFEEWRLRVALPEAVVVSSGGGLHAYWPLRSALGRSQWEGLAHRLRALAQDGGLHIDPGSTIDAARILRPPATNNRKVLGPDGKKLADVGGPSRPVVAGPLRGPYDLTELKALGEVAAAAPQEVPAFLKGKWDDDHVLNIGSASEEASNPVYIADRCAQVRRLREARGNLPEPEWYAVLGVLAHCGEAGRAAAHEWSAGDQRYREADTDAKLNQYLANASGPTTCARFGSLVNGPCILCPHAGTITSPIQLGRDMPAATLAPAPSKVDLPLLPKGFRWSGQRLAIERKPTDDDPSDIQIISEYPITVQELQETERSARISTVLRSWEPMQGGWRDFSLGMGEITAQGGAAKVADHGVIINKRRWDQFILYINACANDFRGTRHYGVRYEQFGWKQTPTGPAFVLGDHMLRPGTDPPQRIHGNDEVDRRGRLMAPRGDAAAWTTAADKLLAQPGLEAHAFMLLCAFAAPLYHFTGEVGATLVHGVSREGGKGKTTILDAGSSVYGPQDALSIIERDTMVAKFVTLGTLCHLPVFFDELRFPDPDDTKHYVLQTTLGRDKQRGKAEGGLRSDQYNWSTVHISAANISLIDTVRTDGAEVAQASRIFEFSLVLPEGTRTTDGDALKKILRANAGTAGRVFLQEILNHYNWVQDAVSATMKKYEIEMQAGPEERFILRLFACVAVAGTFVAKCNLLHVDLNAIMKWAIGVQRGNAGRLAVESVIDPAAIVSRLINDMTPHTIVMPKAQTQGRPAEEQIPRQLPRGELKARLEIDGRRLLIDVIAVRKWMQQNNYSFTEIQKELMASGILKDARKRATLGAGSGRAIGQTWNWQIDGQHPLLQDLIDTVAAPPAENNVVQLRGKS